MLLCKFTIESISSSVVFYLKNIIYVLTIYLNEKKQEKPSNVFLITVNDAHYCLDACF